MIGRGVLTTPTFVGPFVGKQVLNLLPRSDAICVGLLENSPSCIQLSNELLIVGTVQDVMPLILHSIEQSNHSA